MLSRALRLLVLVAAAGLAGAGAGPAWAQDDELEAMATALKDTTFTLQDGLKAGEREGQPISAQFEIDDGKLQISIYTTKGDDFSEVVADPKTGAIVKTEKITDTDELNDAADQKAAMAKAKTSLAAAADAAVKENSGFPRGQHLSRSAGWPCDCRGHLVAGRRRQKRLRKSWIELRRWPLRLGRTRALVDQNGPEIVDVGARRAGDEQVAEPGEHRIGIIVG